MSNPTSRPSSPTFVFADLQKSGLTMEDFFIEFIKDEAQIRQRLGFTSFGGTPILPSAAYWISYPNKPGYYRLKLREKIGDAKYLSPKESGNHPYILPEIEPLLNNYSPDKPVFITEGEKKAAKATVEGFPCIGISGVWNFKDKENDFLMDLNKYVWKDRTVYILFDSDITQKHSVKQAEIRLSIELTNRGANVLSVRLPNEPDGEKNGLDDYLVRHGNEAFEELVKSAKPTLELHITDKTDFTLILKELTRISNEVIRVKTIKALATREGANMEAMEAEYKKYLPEDKSEKPTTKEVFTSEQIEKARALLNSPDILSDMLILTRKQGFAGEERNQKLLYLAFTSRLFMKDSISAIVKGESAGGKSHLVGSILNLFPESDVLKFSFMTAKALVHSQGDLSHKILHLAEHSGGEGADYSIRTALSEGEISIMIPEKNEITGKWETVVKRIPAKGLVFVETTTRERVHYENQTRLFDLYIDESEEQTRNILLMQAAQLKKRNPGATEEIKVWRAAQTLLKNYSVLIPFSAELAGDFPIDKIRARRDFPRLCSLIQAHALLFQSQREIDPDGCLIAEVKDFEAVLVIADDVLSQSMKDVSPKEEKTLTIIQKEFSGIWFSVKELSEKVGKSPTYRTIQRYLNHFVKNGFIQSNGEKPPNSRYMLSTPVSSCRHTPIFTPNLLKSLNNNDDKTDCRHSVVVSSLSRNHDNDDRPRQNENVVTDSNNNGGLHGKNGVTTMTTEGKGGILPLIDRKAKGSTDPDDFSESDNTPELDTDPWDA